MILQSLVRVAERQAASSAHGNERGFDTKKVEWIIDIDLAGVVHGVTWTGQRSPGAKKDDFLTLSIPKRCGRTSGVAADLLVDKAGYLFGLETPKKKDRRNEQVIAALEALAPLADLPEVAAQMAAMRQIVADLPAFSLIWSRGRSTVKVPCLSGEVEVPKDWVDGHLFAFRIVGGLFIIAVPKVRAWISAQAAAAGVVDADSANQDLCLVTGLWSTPKTLIDAVSLPGPAGDGGPIKLISFNAEAFCHLTRSGNENAPISVDAADRLFDGLQYLCRPKSTNLKRLNGKTTVLFWMDGAIQSDALDDLLGPCLEADPATVRRVEAIYAAPQDGRPAPAIDSTPFCSLVLTREKGRVSVRSALLSTVGDVAQHVLRWFRDLDLGYQDGPPYRALWMLAKAIVARDDEPAHDLMSRFYLCAITGAPLPVEGMAAILRRLRAHDKDADSPSRIALIKATLIRSYHKEIPVSLDPDYPDTAYHLGRLFALLEQIQDKAINANAGIADRYLGAAMGTPALVFPRLLKLHHHHLSKIGGGLEVTWARQIDGIVAKLPPRLPTTQKLADQGTFMVGYHHQRAQRFVKTTDTDLTNPKDQQ